MEAGDIAPFGDTSAVLGVSRGGTRKVVATGQASEDSRFRVASLTKTFTAVATVTAARRAGLSLEAPVVEVLPDLDADWAADRALSLQDVRAGNARARGAAWEYYNGNYFLVGAALAALTGMPV